MTKRGYHHGNLRQALVDTTLDLIREKGPTGFTLSQAAKQAGVTPAAVYRHFEGREDIIAEAALQGYRIFVDAMKQVRPDTCHSAVEKFKAAGHAYLDFARDYPGHYIAMFESGISVQRDDALLDISRQARGVLNDMAQDTINSVAGSNPPTLSNVSAHFWALCHGIVEIFMRNSSGAENIEDAYELLNRGAEIYIAGLS